MGVAVERNGDRTRFDIRSVDAPVSPFRFDGLTILVDGHAQQVTVWNSVSQTYFTQSLVPGLTASPASTPTPRPSARPSRPERSPIADLDLLALDIRLGERRLVLGMPSTGLTMDARVRRRGTSSVMRLTGSTQIADTYAFFPLTVALTASRDNVAVLRLAYGVDAYQPAVPPDADFAIPDGYRLAPNVFAVINAPPAVRPSPAPAPSSTPS
jgi:hypothetical protein